MRGALVGRGEVVGAVGAARLGIVTPFCSCSAVPLFIGFVEAGMRTIEVLGPGCDDSRRVEANPREAIELAGV